MKALYVMAAALAIGGAASSAEAQFTTVVAPPRPKQEPQVAQTAAAQSAARDTVLRARLTDMKAWVDSAAVALSAAPPRPRADTAAARRDSVAGDTASVRDRAARRPAEEPARPVSKGDVSFRDGARAPDTATPLPLLALIGAGSLAVGGLLRRKR